ncbi:hypothetical protein [Pseudonocardia parietis]|uniref:Uncharacterized protein n=1 Tax=Pseudonocardia parietis TaxID=570936 RepID=A0ABS4VW43_9PSEU|nr:hypothetical protein [Pseudonocardia parietis]MBP2368145.1 hypothetical protein [Pseudonocardia parietis]
MGAVITAIATGLLVAGATALATDRLGRDAAGFVTSGIGTVSTNGAALRSDPVLIHSDPDAVTRVVGEVALQATAHRGEEVFVAIGPTAHVARYLDGVAHGVWRGEATSTGPTSGSRVDELAGTSSATRPGTQTFWVASASGPATQTARWTPEPGNWTAVVMDSDGSGPVTADVQVAAQVPGLGATSAAAVWTGVGLLDAGIAVIVVGARSRREREEAPR